MFLWKGEYAPLKQTHAVCQLFICKISRCRSNIISQPCGEDLFNSGPFCDLMRLRNEIVAAVKYSRTRSRNHDLPLSLALTYGMVCCFLLASPPAQAQEETQIRYRTEANFLAHFASFVEWPPSTFPNTQAPFQLCVFGNLDFVNSILELTKHLK